MLELALINCRLGQALAEVTLVVEAGWPHASRLCKGLLLCRAVSSAAGDTLRAVLDDKFSPSEQLCHPVPAVFLRWLLFMVPLLRRIWCKLNKKMKVQGAMNCAVPSPLPGTRGLLPLRSSAWISGGSRSHNLFLAEC